MLVRVKLVDKLPFSWTGLVDDRFAAVTIRNTIHWKTTVPLQRSLCFCIMRKNGFVPRHDGWRVRSDYSAHKPNGVGAGHIKELISVPRESGSDSSESVKVGWSDTE